LKRHILSPGFLNTLGNGARDAVQNSGAAQAQRIGMGCKALFAANSPAIGKKSNAADRPSPHYSGPSWVLNTIPNRTTHATP
jgi:hypothetical protein